MHVSEMWVPIVLFAAIAVVISFWLYFRYRSRHALQQTVQAAIEKGQDLSPELLDRLGQPNTSGDTDMRRGVIAIGIGIAFAVFAFVLDERDAVRPLLATAAFPFVIGVAYLALWRLAGSKS